MVSKVKVNNKSEDSQDLGFHMPDDPKTKNAKQKLFLKVLLSTQ